MKIRGWSIDGFGVFHDSSVAGLPDGLTVLHGANEAGKSTLLEFLRRVLFGVPESSNGAAYPPVRGGRHRGRLVVGDDRGEVIVERELDQRRPPLLRRPDGSGLEPSMLSRLLGGADERLFRSVFAFSIDDLRSLAVLDAAGLRDALFSATLAGAGRSARATAQALHAQAAARLDGDGPAQIGRLIAELNTLRPRLNAARRGALAYSQERATAQRLADAIDAQRTALAMRRAARTRDDALLRAWPAWQALQSARAELAALDPHFVSADAEARVRAARARLDAAGRAAEATRAEQLETERQLGLLPALDPSGALSSEVEALAADAPLHRLHVATLPAARARTAEAEVLLRERLHRAGDEWSADRLRQWSRATLDRDGVRDWQVRLRAVAEREQQAEWRSEAAGSATETARRARDRAAAELPSAPALGGTAIERQRQTLATLRMTMEEMAARRAHGEATAQALHERERALRELEAQQDPAPSPLLRTGMEIAAVASGGAGVWLLAQGAMPFGAGLGVLAAAAAGVSRWAGAQQRAHARREEERHLERRALRSEMEASRRSRDSEWHRAAELADEIARLAASLGLSRAPSPAEVEMRERALDADALAETQIGLARARVAELERTLADREAEERVRLEELSVARTARQKLEAEWAAWRAASGFSAETTPDDVLERVAALEAAQVALAAYDAAARELRHIEPQVAAWTERARAVLARGGAPLPSLGDEALVDHVLALRLRLQEEAPQRARRAALERELRERAGHVAAADAELERCRSDLESVLRASGVRDEAELIRRRAVAEHRVALEGAIDEHERLAVERLGDPQAMADLATGAVDTWRQRARAADAEIAGLEQQLYQLVAEHQQVRANCRALEASAEVPTLEAEWASLMAELAEAVRDWRVVTAAEGLIEEARTSFERTRQPGVLRAASQAFALVTAGRYAQIVQDESGQALQVIDRDGRRKEVGHELSRGTAEQLYISLRLGLAQELAERGIALPLVMDDVLVHFDPVRARAMAEVLGAFARSQQVLFFTCHAATRDLLLEHGHADRLVEL